jgi:NAD(P)-dependent dehydrogenase (short-subunit alcohol dehydrogenase family)
MKGKVVVITGAFGALGRVVAAEAAKRGARVALVDYAQPPADVTGAMGGDHLFLGGADLTSEAGAESAMKQVTAKFGRIDALVNIAGGFTWKLFADGSMADWDRMFAMNLKTAANATRAALPSLIASGAGRVVNIGANGALKAGAGMGAYAASKSAVHRLTESLAEELKGKVTVNAVLPSIIDTAANRKDMPDADFSKCVSPLELASVILFLASDEAGAVTGALIPVTGRV